MGWSLSLFLEILSIIHPHTSCHLLPLIINCFSSAKDIGEGMSYDDDGDFGHEREDSFNAPLNEREDSFNAPFVDDDGFGDDGATLAQAFEEPPTKVHFL